MSILRFHHNRKIELEVASDYFDYIDLPSNRLGVLVADASGHGVSAELMMPMLKSQLLTAAVDDPAQLLSQLNRSRRKFAPKNMFVNAAYVFWHSSHKAEVIMESYRIAETDGSY